MWPAISRLFFNTPPIHGVDNTYKAVAENKIRNMAKRGFARWRRSAIKSKSTSEEGGNSALARILVSSQWDMAAIVFDPSRELHVVFDTQQDERVKCPAFRDTPSVLRLDNENLFR